MKKLALVILIILSFLISGYKYRISAGNTIYYHDDLAIEFYSRVIDGWIYYFKPDGTLISGPEHLSKGQIANNINKYINNIKKHIKK